MIYTGGISHLGLSSSQNQVDAGQFDHDRPSIGALDPTHKLPQLDWHACIDYGPYLVNIQM